LSRFLDGADWRDVRHVSRAEALEEAWFLGLRLNEGVSISELEREFGVVEAHQHDDEILELVALGLVDCGGNRVRLTSRGRLMSNEVFERFVGDAVEDELVLVD
jgi:oxygen-independent coproporphyrinogen-3 oxidase